MNYFLLIFGVITAVLLVVLWLVFRRRKSAKKQNEALSHYMIQKYADMKALIGVLVIHKGSGVMIHKKIFDQQERFESTSDLLSGLIQAVALIGRQFGQMNEFSRLEYGDFKIIANQGAVSRCVCVLKREPSSSFEDAMFLFMKKFEKQYRHRLENFDGLQITFAH